MTGNVVGTHDYHVKINHSKESFQGFQIKLDPAGSKGVIQLEI